MLGGGGFGWLWEGASSLVGTAPEFPIKGEVWALDLGSASGYTLLKDGNALFWGYNNKGQLGLGNTHETGDNEGFEFIDYAPLGGGGHPVIARFSHGLAQASFSTAFDASDSYVNTSPATYSWSFGDNTPAVSGLKAIHTFASAGKFTVILTVTDGLGQTDTASHVVEVSEKNRPPFFWDSSQTFTVYQGEANSLSLPSARDEGTALSYVLVAAPLRGVLANCLSGDSDLVCDYTPDPNSVERTSFTYKVNDGSMDSLEVFTVLLKIMPPR